jgi:hypothetical protein
MMPSEEAAILEEALDNLSEAAQKIRATQNRLWSAGLEDNPNYRALVHRLRTAFAMTEAAYVVARRRSGQRLKQKKAE